MTDIVFDAQGTRYVLPLDGGEEAQVDVRVSEGVMTVRRVFVPPSQEGRGLASRLMAHVSEDARAQGLKIVPVCSYADAWFRRHKDMQDLLGS
ncbi:MAG: N-acetyltransferase [Caulobacteraceae bacterium]|nr:N-acetyltransferase [Caulobacteraceae bacterium]